MRINRRFAVLLLAWSGLTATRALAQTCNQTSSYNYLTTTATGTRQGTGTGSTAGSPNTYTDAVSGTSYTFNNYKKLSTAGTNTNNFLVGTNTNLSATKQFLYWQVSYASTATLANNQSSVVLTFNRAVSNLVLNVGDIDLSTANPATWRDDVTFDAYTTLDANGNPTGTPLALSAANFATNVANQYVSGNVVNGKANAAADTQDGNVTVTFPANQSIRALVLTYRNTLPLATSGTNERLQILTINSVSFCAQADVATSLTGPATAAIGSTVTFVATIANNGADQVTSVRPTVQLPQNLTNVTGGTYVASTGLLTLAAIPNLAANASVTRNITFTMPGTAVTGVVSVPTTGDGSTTAGSSAPDPALANNNGSLDNASVTTTPPYSISGTVFEDINYGGGVGRSIATANAITANSAVGVGTAGTAATAATVELYNATTGAFIASTTTSTTTGSLGQYTFTNLPGGTSYITRVVNSTVRSTRTGSTAALVGVQTFNGSTDQVGGEAPNLIDAAANTTNANLSTLTPANGTTAAQSLATVNIGTANAPNTDFGFNFDVVVNTNDAGQGSLRQFVLNANTLGGEASLAQRGSRINAAGTTVALPAGQETSIFMIPSGSAVVGQGAGLVSGLTNGVAVISTTTALTLTGANAANTVIDGTTQTFNIGNTSTGTATNATATTVGVDNVALGGVQKPEVEISGSAATVIDLEAASLTLRGLAAHGGSSQTVLVGNTTASSGYVLENALIGATANGVRPTTNPSGGYGIAVFGNAGVGTVQNSLVAYNGFSGMNVRNGTGTAGTSQFVSNFFVKNGFTQGGGDGITFGDGALSGPANVANNFFTNQNSSALQFEIGTTSATTVTNNTITNSGAVGDAGAAVSDVEGGGIVYLQRDGTKRGSQADVISKNVITNSQSAGIVVGYGQQNVTISQNNTNGNGGLGIDLINNTAYYVGSPNATGAADYGDGDGVTLNDGSNTATATLAVGVPNKGLDYPIIISATIVGNTLVVKGYSQPGITAEFFLRDADSGNFGEGQTYLGGGVENGTGDLNTATTTLTYAGTINGLSQGSDNSNTARAYTFSLDISTLTPAQLSALTANGLTASATLSGAGTSEFSAKAPVNTAPVPNTLTNVSIPNNSGATVLSPNLSGTANGTLSTGTANSISYYTVTSLANLTSGTLTYNGTALTTANIATTQIANPALLRYTPVAGYTGGSVSFTYTATDANGITSTTNNNGGTVTNGPATYTIPVSQVADVTTVLSGPATLNQGQPTGTYTATYTNNGPNPAAGVTQQVTLPADASLTATQLATIQNAYSGTTYNSATRVLYFSGAPVTLASTTTNTFTFAFTAPTTTSGTTTLASAVTTTTGQGANTAADAATLSIQVNAAAPNNCAVSYYDGTKSYGGLSADYYQGNYNNDATWFSSRTPSEKNVAAVIDYATTGNNAANTLGTFPITSATVPTNNAAFSARYRGNVTITQAGSYSFSIQADDRVQMWIDGNAVPVSPTATPIINIPNYSNGQPVASTPMPLSAGKHNILVFYAGTGRPDNISLSYSGPDSPTLTIIPNSVLCAGLGNVPPTALAVTTAAIPNNAGPTTISPLNGTDFETTGSVTNYAIATIPDATTQGTLRLNGVAVTAGQVITAAQAATLTFQPVTGYTGANITFTFSAIDNSNQYSNTTALYTIPVTAAADVTTALTGPQTVSPGQPTGTYTASFTNEGPGTASNVGRTVTLPAGATNILVNGAAYTPTTANTIDFTSATTLASGASNSFTFSFTPATSATGTVAITSNVTAASSQGADSAPNASMLTAQVTPVADVATTISATTPTVAAGTPASAGTPPKFTVMFTNNGPATANGVMAAVQLPANLTNVTITFPNGANGISGTYAPATGVVTYAGSTSIPSTGSITSAITFDAPATSSVVASSTISTTTNEAGLTANNKASATMTITPAFDLTTTLTGPTTAVAGDLVTLAVTTTNNGPNAVANAVQTVQLVSGLANVYVSNGGVYNSGTSTQTLTVNGVSYSVPAGGVVFPTIASLPSGQTVANSVSFSQVTGTTTNPSFAPSALVTPNTASTSTTTGDTNTNNNTAFLNGTTSTNVAVVNSQTGTANVYTTITTSAASTTVGSPVTLTVMTGNKGPNPATGVTQTVQLLPGFTTATLKVNNVIGGAPVNNVITFGTNGPTYNVLTGIVTFPTLTDGTNGSTSATSVTNTITITPSAATATTVATTGSNGQLLAMAAVRTTNTDPVAADNVASVAVTLVQSTDLATTISGPASALPGQSVTYTATFTNNGPMDATGVTESAQLPAGLGAGGVTITDAAGTTVSGASYSTTTGLVTFPNLAADANGATQIFKLTFAAPAQSFAPGSSVNSTSSDAVGTNNTASVATMVAATADLATTVAGPATAVVGNAVTYTVNTTNNGPVAATSAVTALQLASGFSTSTLQVNGVTGTLGTGNTITYTFGAGATATTATYNTSTGLVTFPTVASLPAGASAANYVTFTMPSPTGGQTSGVASASAAGTDPVPTNNSASVATSIAPTTTATADLAATVTVPAGTPTNVAAGSALTYTATYSNIGINAATNVLPTLQLQPGLTTATLQSVSGGAGSASGNTITFPNGTTYNTQTGVITFPPIASQATGTAGNVNYTVQIVVPSNGPLVATAVTTSNTSEPSNALANNANSLSLGITPSFNEVTSISGPASALAGTSQTYTVTATNNGPSATSNVTTQMVTVPAGQTPTNITNGGMYSSGANTITWTIAAGQAPGANGAVANSFTLVQPAAGLNLTASVQVTGESNTTPADNTATISTTATNQPPLAYAVVNSLQNPQSNDAGGLATGLPISSLNASDPENSFNTNKYTIVAAPDASQGTLYYSNDGTATGTYTALASSQTLTSAQGQTLRFKANPTFVGNASFTYSAKDAANNVSPTVSYTIPVESDVNALAYTVTPTKGSTAGAYTVGDVIAFTTDANGAVFNAATASVYQADGTLQTDASNGIASASAVAGSFTSSRADVTSLTDIGLSVDPMGRIVVSNPGTLANPVIRSGSYSVQIATVDINGGTSTRTVSFVIGTNPLPVVLTAFTASAVLNRDAQLSWTTASEVNSAYFDLERSFDGTTFAKVGRVAAQGTTPLATTYAFTDQAVASRATGAVFYRLKQVDRDAQASYSPVRTVRFTQASVVAVSLFPNPAQTATSLDLRQLPATGTYQVLVLDATGRTVRSASLGGGQVQPLDLHELATGTYHVLVTGTLADGAALRQTLRLTKE